MITRRTFLKRVSMGLAGLPLALVAGEEPKLEPDVRKLANLRDGCEWAKSNTHHTHRSGKFLPFHPKLKEKGV